MSININIKHQCELLLQLYYKKYCKQAMSSPASSPIAKTKSTINNYVSSVSQHSNSKDGAGVKQESNRRIKDQSVANQQQHAPTQQQLQSSSHLALAQLHQYHPTDVAHEHVVQQEPSAQQHISGTNINPRMKQNQNRFWHTTRQKIKSPRKQSRNPSKLTLKDSHTRRQKHSDQSHIPVSISPGYIIASHSNTHVTTDNKRNNMETYVNLNHLHHINTNTGVKHSHNVHLNHIDSNIILAGSDLSKTNYNCMDSSGEYKQMINLLQYQNQPQINLLNWPFTKQKRKSKSVAAYSHHQLCADNEPSHVGTSHVHLNHHTGTGVDAHIDNRAEKPIKKPRTSKTSSRSPHSNTWLQQLKSVVNSKQTSYMNLLKQHREKVKQQKYIVEMNTNANIKYKYTSHEKYLSNGHRDGRKSNNSRNSIKVSRLQIQMKPNQKQASKQRQTQIGKQKYMCIDNNINISNIGQISNTIINTRSSTKNNNNNSNRNGRNVNTKMQTSINKQSPVSRQQRNTITEGRKRKSAAITLLRNRSSNKTHQVKKQDNQLLPWNVQFQQFN